MTEALTPIDRGHAAMAVATSIVPLPVRDRVTSAIYARVGWSWGPEMVVAEMRTQGVPLTPEALKWA